jgi:hypothetical protein
MMTILLEDKHIDMVSIIDERNFLLPRIEKHIKDIRRFDVEICNTGNIFSLIGIMECCNFREVNIKCSPQYQKEINCKPLSVKHH